MEQNLLQNHEQQHGTDAAPQKQKWHWAYFVWGGVAVVVVGLLVAAPMLYVSQYTSTDKVVPGVYIGEHHVGGLTQTELKTFVESFDTKLVEDGFALVFEDGDGVERETAVLPLVYTQVLGQSFSYASIQVEDTVRAAMAIGREGNLAGRTFDALRTRMAKRQLDAEVVILEEEFDDVLQVNLGEHETPMLNAGLSFASSTPAVTDERPGEEFDYGAVIAIATENLRKLDLEEIAVPRITVQPTITAREAEPLLEVFDDMTSMAEFTLEYTAPPASKESLAPQKEKTWTVKFADIESMIGFQKSADGEVLYGLEKEPFELWLAPIAETIDVLPQEAKFALGDGANKVTQFQPSRNGISVSSTVMFASVNTHFADVTQQASAVSTSTVATSELPTLALAYDIAEPTIKTAEVNELGITEHLSTGISRFIGSSRDRIKNIKNASTKLNGLLIPPGEEFSLVKTIRPITRENGYVPEFIIKGDSIEKGIGGGLCQIGTTSFRMAMNAGMKVTERHNHSLVVSYYNDLTNGNPGTDATIFDPVLDFKFLNDTENYVLMTTEVDVPNQELRYHLWGTSDGRKGYYTPPVVHKWIPTGPSKEIKTTDRAPGERWCQSVHPGAVTSFTYTVEKPDGTVEETLYESRYRPLPQICFIGVTEEELAAEEAKKAAEENGEPIDEVTDGFKEDPEEESATEDAEE